MLAHQIAVDPDAPAELTCSDGLVIPWRPVRSAGGDDGYFRGIEINPEYLADWDLLWDLPELVPSDETCALWVPCLVCNNGLWKMPGGELVQCVRCRGTAQLPYAFIGQDFTYGVIPSD